MCDFDSKACWKCGHRLGITLALAFIICFLWFYVNPVEQGLHLALFKVSFLGYTGMNGLSFLLGLIQSYIWGLIFAGLWFLAGMFIKKK